MLHATSQHPNAVLTPTGRRRMVACVIDRGWTIEQTAERFQIDAKTVRKWRDRYLADGAAGLLDRSSRPHRSPNRTSDADRARIIELRRRHRWGADHIAHEVGIAASTVQSVLRSEGLGRLDRGDRATDREPVRRYQRDRPGELVHVNVKKLSGIPDGGGWRIHGRGQAPSKKRSTVGYRFIHTAVDDRIAYSEILPDEQGATAAAFWYRAHTWFATHGITIERALTDSGSCYKSRIWRTALDHTGVAHKRTRPYRPQTNGKVERFHRILLEEWAYVRDWQTDTQRRDAYDGFMHFYNHHRSHGALGWASPIDTLTHCSEDNVPGRHT
ncbi:MAG: IS481 family transposase [Ilumatobacter sp.]|uniref:IS481 family transposase n=1 Tax=Ilumatobacter sp. TaxID=1967498 RepID=UPI0026269E96|nr:IS481 family transposase [Ilumatobacter sp.]MDJ0768446.1 IS481 family transposase [Ilumatobacter sp.]